MSALIKINDWDVIEIDGEPLIKDTELAERLGYTNPNQIRKLIKRMIEDGSFGDEALYYTLEKQNDPKAYDLNKKQAIKVISRSETKNANQILDEVIDVFTDWEHDNLSKTLKEELLLAVEEDEKSHIDNKASKELDKSKEYCTVKRMTLLTHGIKFDWVLLNEASVEMNIHPIYVFDLKYGTVPAYHKDVWIETYALEF